MEDFSETLSTRGRVFCWGNAPFSGEKEVIDCSCKENQHLIGTQCTAESEVGICKINGKLFCNSEEGELECIPGTSTTEICNGIDDDCDGIIDNNGVVIIAGQCYESSSSGIKNFDQCKTSSILIKRQNGLYCYNYRDDEDFSVPVILPNKVSSFKKIHPSPPKVEIKSDKLINNSLESVQEYPNVEVTSDKIIITVQQYKIPRKLKKKIIKKKKKYNLHSVKLYYRYIITEDSKSDIETNNSENVILSESIKTALSVNELSNGKNKHAIERVKKKTRIIINSKGLISGRCTAQTNLLIKGKTKTLWESIPSDKTVFNLPKK